MTNSLFMVIPELNAKIRRTEDGRCSIYDLIGAAGKGSPRSVWKRLTSVYPEVFEKIDSFKFPGRGQQETPVTDLKGWLYILGLLPGTMGRKYREEAAQLVTRYIRGDVVLASEVISLQNQLRLPVTSKHNSESKKLERDLEAELLYWLDQQGIIAEQQVASRGKRTDVWIPGECFLELKRGKVTGDDVCQATKYYTLYSRQIILVGETLSLRAGEGISAINKITRKNALAFVTWSGIKTYLKARLA
ncbi:MAG: hypothetical protein AAGF93_00345 [Cyanobacteria bacterium P01_H01_bin.105]